MMREEYKRVIALVCTAAMMASFTGCLDKDKDTIISNADSYAKALMNCSVKGIRKGSTEDFDDYLEELRERLDWDSSAERLYNAILDTMSYKVDEKSYETGRKGEASVDVVFEMVDWESIDDDDIKDVDSFVDAIEDCDEMTEVTVTLEYEKEDDKWLVANYEEACEDFFEAWMSAPLPVDYSTVVLEARWYYADSYNNGQTVYNNTGRIELDLTLDRDYEDLPVYYIVKFNGNDVYTSPVGPDSNEGAFTTNDPGAVSDGSGYLVPGEYTITFYSEDGTELASDSCTVTTVSVVVDTSDVSAAAEIFDTAVVDHLRWWYATSRGDQIVYDTVSAIDLDMYYPGYNNWIECYYEVSYNGELIYTSPKSEDSREGMFSTSYPGARVDDTGNLAGGEYTITFYDANGNKLACDTCTVEGNPVDDIRAPLTPDSVVSTKWWFATTTTAGAEYADPTLIDLDLELSSEYSGAPVYYEVRYNGDLVYTSPVSSSSINGYFRSTDDGAVLSPAQSLIAGEYQITFFAPDGTELASDKCIVVNN